MRGFWDSDDGERSLAVRTVDADGRTTGRTRTVTVDGAAPVIDAPGNERVASFGITIDNPAMTPTHRRSVPRPCRLHGDAATNHAPGRGGPAVKPRNTGVTTP